MSTVTLTIGRDPSNDLVIDQPMVSSHHAHVVLTFPDERVTIEDLASTNGVFVGAYGNKIDKCELHEQDTVYLGSLAIAAAELIAAARAKAKAAALALAKLDQGSRGREEIESESELESEFEAERLMVRKSPMVLGRDPGVDVVIDLATVSWRHARIWRGGSGSGSGADDGWWIEDLGSANGTTVNGRPVGGGSNRARVYPGDRIGLGSRPYLLDFQENENPIEALETSAGAMSAGEWETRPRSAAVLPAASAILALLVVALARGSVSQPITAENWGNLARGLSSVNAALALGAVVLGCLGVPAMTGWNAGRGGWPLWDQRTGRVLMLSMASAGVFVILVHGGCALRSEPRWLIGISAASAAIGFLLAWLTLAWRGARGVGVLVGLLIVLGLPMIFVPLNSLPAPARAVMALTPTRWAFEAFCLQDAGRRASIVSSVTGSVIDLAEPAFPASSARMGEPACLAALAWMLGGLVVAATVVGGAVGRTASAPRSPSASAVAGNASTPAAA